MEEFVSSANLDFNAKREEKTVALARDYLKKGKEVEWVMQQTCGHSAAMKRRVVSLAVTMGAITERQAEAIREAHRINSKRGR